MFQIQNRRYLGNKTKLLPFIENTIQKHNQNFHSFLDLFGGTGVVAYHFAKQFHVSVNDILLSNIYAYQTFLSSEQIDEEKLREILLSYNSIHIEEENYYSIHFGNTYLSEDNMKLVGFIRDNIDCKYYSKQINQRERAILITSLLYAIDKIARTVGHYDAFRKEDKIKPLKLEMPYLENLNCNIYHQHANELVRTIQTDIVYLDPPYNSRQYGDAYHFLENVAENHKKSVEGVARKMNRDHLKSPYCTTKATEAFQEVIDDIQAKLIVVSYNNTGNKINSRSNAKISDEDMLRILKTKGEVFIYEQDFSAFNHKNSNIKEHKERLFVCEVKC